MLRYRCTGKNLNSWLRGITDCRTLRMAACCEKAEGSGHGEELSCSPEPNKSPELTVTQIMGEAEEYVDAIMATQSLNPAIVNNEDHDLLVPNTRKRNLSSSSSDMSDVKKAKGNGGNCKSPESADTPVTDRVLAKARRSLYGGTPQGSHGFQRDSEADNSYERLIMKKLDVISLDIQKVNDTLSQRLTEEIKKVNSHFNKRIDKLESDMEKRLSDKMAQILDKRVNSEMKRIRQVTEQRIDNVRGDLSSEIEELRARMDSVVVLQPGVGHYDRTLNVAIRRLPQSVNEDTAEKVNRLIKDQLHIRDVEVASAYRVEGGSDRNQPEIVIAKFRSVPDRQKVLKAKKKLKLSSMKNVFIHPDQSKEERMISSNMRVLVDAINKGDRKLFMRGSRVNTQVNELVDHEQSRAYDCLNNRNNRNDNHRQLQRRDSQSAFRLSESGNNTQKQHHRHDSYADPHDSRNTGSRDYRKDNVHRQQPRHETSEDSHNTGNRQDNNRRSYNNKRR